jgi:hypothetical protein
LARVADGRHQLQGVRYPGSGALVRGEETLSGINALSGEAATEEARYVSIMTTGWDPELGRFEWDWHSLETDLAMAMKIPTCRSLLGDSDVSTSDLITNMAFADPATALAVVRLTVPAPSPVDPKWMDWHRTQIEPLDRIAKRLTPAGTWNAPDGTFLGYVIGPSFGALSTSEQMTVMVHEFFHATGRLEAQVPTDQEIAQACGTAVP